jgi:hypothetical protein
VSAGVGESGRLEKRPKARESAAAGSRPPSGAFDEMLRWHFRHGTHPDLMRVGPGFRWKPEAFSAETKLKDDGNHEVSPQAVNAWLRGDATPENSRLQLICGILFGDDPQHARAKAELCEAWIDAGERKRSARRRARRTAAPQRIASPPQIAEPARCYGRQEDVDAVVRQLASGASKAIALLGPGGIGKTTLAAKIVTDPRLSSFFESRCWIVRLADARTAAEFEQEIARALGFDPQGTRLPFLIEHVRGRVQSAPGLMVLDNLETPWDESRVETRTVLDRLGSVGASACSPPNGGSSRIRRPGSPVRLAVCGMAPTATRSSVSLHGTLRTVCLTISSMPSTASPC